MLVNFKQRQIRLLQTATGVALTLAAQNVLAGSFQLYEQSTTYLGTAFSGTASTAEDCSTGYYNPAGLTQLKHSEALISGVYLNVHMKLYDAAGMSQAGDVVSGDSTVRPSSNMVIPGFHVSTKINHRWSVALAVVEPFGSNIKYPSDSVARDVVTLFKIETYDITPSVAYKINEQFSLGAGFDAMQLKVTLNKAVSAGLGEGYLNNKADSWSYGYHVGVLYKPNSETKMGLVYFSKFDTTIKGKTDELNFIPRVTSFTSRIHLPDRVVYSITHKYSAMWTAVADVEFVHWSRLKDFTFVYTGLDSLITKVPLQNKNAWRVAIGSNYDLCDAWKIKAGLAWDQSPVKTQYRVARLPDSDKFWLALGVKYKCNKALSLDVAYAHLFIKSGSINQHDTRADSGVSGKYKTSGNLIGAQLTWSFV